MLLKLNTPYVCNFLVKDSNNNAITNDIPTVCIFNSSTNEYFNGINYIANESKIILSYTQNGIYQFVFIPSKTGLYKITYFSSKTNLTTQEYLDVEDITESDNANWKTNTPYSVTSSDLNAQVTIQRNSDSAYFNGTVWGSAATQIAMSTVQNISQYIFTPLTDGIYTINVSGATQNYSVVLTCSATFENISPIQINNSTFLYLDGSDSLILDENNNPISDVIITCYDSITKQIYTKTVSSNGQWAMILKPGKYFFTFEKDGFYSVNFEKVVA